MKLIRITSASSCNVDDLNCINVLVKQLSDRAPRVTPQYLARVLTGAYLFIAEKQELPPGSSIVGMGTLVVKHLLSGHKVQIEDLVVHEHHRRQGIARALVEEMIADANVLGAEYIDLTSRPDRVAANHLYESLGFKRRETNMYRIDLWT